MLEFDPSESAGFLVGRVAHAMKIRVQEFLDEASIQISAEEISILTVLAHLDEWPQMKPLAEKLGRDATTVSRQIASLENAGLVERSPSPDDGRATVVSVTKQGKKLVKQSLPQTLALRKRAMKGVSEAENELLVRVLKLMLENLRNEE